MSESEYFYSWHKQIITHLQARDKDSLDNDRKGVEGDLLVQELCQHERNLLIHLIDSAHRLLPQ